MLVDQQSRTTLDGLLAAGEVSSTGLHGSNRLASNSLLEALVYGAQAGRTASKVATRTSDDFHALPLENPLLKKSFIDAIDIADVRNSLRATMQRLCGVVRTEAGLQEALQYIGNWSNLLFTRQFDSLEAWETKNMLVVARLVVEGALQRNETRGSHNRSDCEPFDPEEPALHSLFVNGDLL